jgi:hypothetical protein
MEYVPESETIQTILKYPENRDEKFFKNQKELTDFESNVKQFAFPYCKTIKEAANKQGAQKYSFSASSSLVQFYTFVTTGDDGIRKYGYCRSAQSGNHIICLVSYLPWNNVFISLLNKIAAIINEKDVIFVLF